MVEGREEEEEGGIMKGLRGGGEGVGGERRVSVAGRRGWEGEEGGRGRETVGGGDGRRVRTQE